MSRSYVTSPGRGAYRREAVEAAKTLSQSAPVIRIERAVMLQAAGSDELRDYLEKFARVHRHLSVKNLGGMACTYVESRDLNAMLATRYPDLYRHRRDVTELHSNFARRFKTFVDNSLQAHREAEVRGILAERERQGPHDFELFPPYSPLQDKWAVATVALRPHLREADGHALVADLGGNDVLWEELDDIRGYLRDEEGLDLNLMRHTLQKPHLTIVKTARNMQQVNVGSIGPVPEEATLAIPQAWREIDLTRGNGTAVQPL